MGLRRQSLEILEANEIWLSRINSAPKDEPSDKEKWLRAHLDMMLEVTAMLFAQEQENADETESGGSQP